MSKTVTEDGNVRRTEITETITERQRIREVEIVVEDDLKTAELPTSARIHTPATPNQLGRAYGEEPENKSSTKTPTTPPQRLTPLGSGQTPPGGRGAQRHTPPPHQRVQPGRPGSSGPKQAQRHPPGQASRQAPGRDSKRLIQVFLQMPANRVTIFPATPPPLRWDSNNICHKSL
ncbi:unnamed protein product [Heligmosomoides polygyrus]|uniref:DUF2382 domain-containing protein n=1 Tax=Heligmosomoides polygyrus TaxID=6339 RepID=A0A183FG23_HELPZ|nr:unnamed protein product [Heligmosomoides polygyrus]